MAFAIPEIEPKEIVAGDRVQWKRTDLSDFPATEWVLTYYFRGAGAGHAIDIVASADGTDYEVDESPDTTAAWNFGTYFWTAYVSQSTTDRKHVGSGRIVIKQNPVDILGSVDGRSHARRTLEAIDAVIEGRATTDIERYVFQAVGRSVDKMPVKELLGFRDYYANLVRVEDIASGAAKSGAIYMRFSL